MVILVALGVFAVAAGWLIGRPWALTVTIVMPIVAVISRIQQQRHGHPPETWVPATVLFTVVFASLIVAGVLLRRLSGPQDSSAANDSTRARRASTTGSRS